MTKTIQWLLFTAIFNSIFAISAIPGYGITPVRPHQTEQAASIPHLTYIDFENLAYSPNIADDRAAFSLFIHDLVARLQANGLALAISVPDKTVDSAGDT